MISYHGTRGARTGATLVFVNDSDAPDDSDRAIRSLDPEQPVTGFEWGEAAGIGAAQLAFTLLWHHTQNHELAARHYVAFMNDVVGSFALSGWNIDDAEIDAWLRRDRE